MKKPRIILAWMQANAKLEEVAEMIKSCLPIVNAICYQYNGTDREFADKLNFMVNAVANVSSMEYEHPWRNFAYNRNHLIRLCHENFKDYEYILMMDADETLEVLGLKEYIEYLETNVKDSYNVPVAGNLGYDRQIIFRNNNTFRYKGACHEYLEGPNGSICGNFKDLLQLHLRPKTGNAHIRRNAMMLYNAIKEETNSFLLSRYQFYLAQSYYDLGYYLPAIDRFKNRIGFKGWIQEVYISHMMIGKCWSALWQEDNEKELYKSAIAAYVTAMHIDPERLETCFYAMKLMIQAKEYGDAIQFFLTNIQPYDWTPSGLFMERNIYEYELNFWTAILYSKLGANDKALEYASKVQYCSTTDKEYQDQNYENMWYYLGLENDFDHQIEPYEWTVIIPTLWLSNRIEELLATAQMCKYVKEIILVDNDSAKQRIHINEMTKVTILYGQDGLVNDSWNKGYGFSQTPYVAILNDDITLPLTQILEHIKGYVDHSGIIGIDASCYTTEDNNINLKVIASMPSGAGFGCAMFMRKDHYVEIPSHYKIWFGDNVLFGNQKLCNQVICDISIKTEMSTSVDKADPKIIQQDTLNWLKYGTDLGRNSHEDI